MKLTTKLALSFFASFSLMQQNTQAQEYFNSLEYGGSIGVSQYFGDLNPNYGFKTPNIAASLVLRKHINPYISTLATMTYTQVGYKDSFSNNAFQQRRNLSFSSDIIEFAAMAEFNFFWFETGNYTSRYTPFISLGVGGFYYNPKATLKGRKYNLRDLGTEGQQTNLYKDRKYGTIGLAIPIGAGIKWWYKPGVNLSFQLSNRFTANDYIDDVSQTYVGVDQFTKDPSSPTLSSILQDRSKAVNGERLGYAGKKRGDSSTKDQYFLAQFTVTFQLKTYKCPTTNNQQWKNSNVNY